MTNWDFSFSASDKLLDKQVEFVSQSLQGKRIALLISGSISAFQTPDLIRILRKNSAFVQVFCSEQAFSFVTEKSLEWASNNPVVSKLTSQVEHLAEDEFDLYLVAPATYNTINKFANGIANEVLTTTLASALGYLQHKKTKIMLCPVFHHSMYNDIVVASLKKLDGYGVYIHKPRQEDGKNKLPLLADLVASVVQIFND